ncbi:MAG TPA: CusA/CzcA family heavy metal efflux RND transporter [Cyclobacteriaceae bacterium]|nr:CusA/CzcA family heavy metal efflux RND transporter [Cyclobacteriaceae bacterium]
MLNRIIYFSVHNKLFVALLTLLLIAWGSYSITRLPIDALPDITNNQVQVITVSPSYSAEDLEMMVTFPVEQTMSTIPGIEEIRSISRFGLSSVTIVFHEDIDVYWARQQVNERLNSIRADLAPTLGQPELAPLTTGLGEIFQYIIKVDPKYKDKYSIMDLRTIQDWIIRRQLLGVPGVADVSSFGGELKQYEVAVDPDRLRSLNVDFNEILSALELNNENAGGSYIDKNPNAYFIRSEGLIRTLEDVGNTVIKNHEVIPLMIRDAGQVQAGAAIRYGAMTYNDQGEAVGAIVLMLKGANSSEVIGNVKTRIQGIQQTLPDGIHIEAFLDRTKLVRNAITTVGVNLAEGALIVIFVLVLLLGNLRAGLIVASVIPLAMLFAIGMMNLFGVSGNLMSLGAIDFGLIVDGSLIVVEATMHHLGIRGLTRTLTQDEMDAEVYESASRIRTSAAFGEIIILIVYVPILVLVGVEGKMFRPMAQTVSFAILGAFLLSLFYVPAMSARFLSKEPSSSLAISDKLMSFFHRMYEPVLRFVLNNKAIVTTSALALFIACMFIFTQLGAEFIPTLEEGDFAVETRVLPGSSLTKSIDVAGKASRILLSNFPEVKEVVGKIGTSEIPVDPMPMETADLIVVLADHDDWTSAGDRNELAEKMKAKLEEYLPGVSFGFQQPIQMRFNELLTGARQDVVLKIFGEDLDELTNYARRLGNIASTVDGVQDIYVEQAAGLPQIVVRPDRLKLARFGLNIEDVNRVVRAAFAGEKAGIVYEGEKRFDLVVRLEQSQRRSADDLANIAIETPDGTLVPLSQLGTIEIKLVPNQIQREDAKRRITVGFNIRGRDVESVVEEIRGKVGSRINFAPGYYITYGGAFEQLQQASARLMVAVPAALLLILILLYFTFRSLKQGLLIFMAIPFSAIGGVLALWVRGMPFSISAGVGFIALFGVAVLNGIVLVAEFNRLKAGGLTDIRDIILKGTSTRLRPVILTAAVASLGFLPMALSHSGGAEVQRPLATVVIGGLLSATILTLLVLPCLYMWLEKRVRINKTALTIVLLIASISSFAQDVRVVSADEAVDMAMKNNRDVAASGYLLQSQKEERKTSGDIGKTLVSGTFGQYNSYPKNDNNITISQSLPFPTVFGARGRLNKDLVEDARLSQVNRQGEVRYQVRSTWHHLNHLLALHQSYVQLDSIYAIYLHAAVARHKAGETTLLEKLTIEGRSQRVRITLRENEAQIEGYIERLLALTRSGDRITAPQEPVVLEIPPDTSSRSTHIQQYRQQSMIAGREMALQKNLLLPDITLGYFNQTLIGVPLNPAATELATTSNRFQGFQVGLSLPLWLRPQMAKVRSSEFRKRAIESSNEQRITEHEASTRALRIEIARYRETLDYYNSNGRTQVSTIYNQSLRAFQLGETGTIELMLAMQTANELYSGYLEALDLYNQSIVRLEYLTNQN